MMRSLATTALTGYWGDHDELLLLGPWCVSPRSEAEAASRVVRQLPCPWDDVAEIETARRVLERLAESMLDRLCEYLNEVHSIGRSRSYWRIVLGPWLVQHLHPLYDRYVCLARALELERDWDTVVMASSSWRTPRTTLDAVELSVDDAYNLQLYSQVLAGLGLEFRQLPFAWPSPPFSSGVRARLAPLVRRVRSRYRSGRWPAAVLVGMYAEPEIVRQIASRAGFGVRDLPVLPTVPPRLDAARLALAELLDGSSEFDRVVASTLPYALPTIFLEGYENASSCMEARSRRVDVVVSANGWLFTDAFKLAAAAARESGARLIAVQHGGMYGMSRWYPVEDHEAGISDTYFVWGWADGEAGKENVPSLKLADATRRSRGHRTSPPSSPRLLFVGTSHPPYLYRFQSFPLGAQWERYEGYQQRFVAALSGAGRDQLVVRPGKPDYGRDRQAPFTAAHPGVRFEPGRDLDFYHAVRKSTCVVVDHCTTVFLESMHLDTPTVIFWDPDLWPLRGSAEPYLTILKDAGIYHETPESAAALIDDLGSSYDSWWRSPAVREARDTFMRRYALSAPDGLEEWVQRLQTEVVADRDDVNTTTVDHRTK